MKNRLKIIAWYIFFIYFFAFLMLSATMAQIDPAPRYHLFGWLNKIFADISFWTTQTNWMFFIFFLFVALNGKWGLWKPGKVAWINFLSYFTLTMVLFWSALSGSKELPLVLWANEYNSFIKWFITVTTHLVTYLIAMIYYFFIVKKEKIDISNWYKKNLLIGWIYPIFYLFFVLIRMLIMNYLDVEHFIKQASNSEISWIEENHEWVLDLPIYVLSTPYFFFNPFVVNGKELIVAGTMVCLLLITLCQYLLIWINNLCLKEKNTSKNNQIIELNTEEKLIAYIKIMLGLIFISVAIYKLTIFSNYNFNNKENTLYHIMYIIVYLFALILNITMILFAIFRLCKIYENKNIEFVSSFFSGFFLIHIYILPIVILIPIIAERFSENKEVLLKK
ncbi:hypothetical protein [Spiroplasma cantharicola]|uniref:Uncharacterized protein n=1 Tax=Spiroplasma cantharicola TaxID=362837 RepID=A0A0M4JJ08_9MOLU|nr:hypothetical protein [Spiroplasma cantharicola]ALD66073.1 hypothetical protein SCANT_v1c01630 [Spiroplasma cantharicola]